MITGHCSSGWHDKCPNPARCTCSCHGARPEPEIAPRRPIERAPGEYRCTACTSDFRTQADLDHHRQTIHRPKKETLPMTEAATPTLCECGCGEPCPPYRGHGPRPRFVDVNHRQRAARRATREVTTTPNARPKRATKRPRRKPTPTPAPVEVDEAPPVNVAGPARATYVAAVLDITPDVSLTLAVVAPAELMKPMVDAIVAGYALGRAGFSAQREA